MEILLSGGMFQRTVCKSRNVSSFVDVTLESTARQCVKDLSDIILNTELFKSHLIENIIVNGNVLFKTY